MPLPRLPDITRLIATLAERSSRHALAVVLGGALLAMLAGWLAVAHLGITTDTEEMFARSLPWRQREIALAKATLKEATVAAVMTTTTTMNARPSASHGFQPT